MLPDKEHSATSCGKKSLFQGPPSVKLVSAHSSKGLEFDSVFVSGLGRQAKPDEDTVTEARLMHVAMTRAMTRLWVIRVGGERVRSTSAESAL